MRSTITAKSSHTPPRRPPSSRVFLRQSREEGFVNLHSMKAQARAAQNLVFASESFENLDNAWRPGGLCYAL
jgi:hypothetical protein